MVLATAALVGALWAVPTLTELNYLETPRPYVLKRISSTGLLSLVLRPREFRDGEIWRAITHVGFHASQSDLFVELFEIAFFGATVERSIGKVGFLVTFFGGVLAGAASFLKRVTTLSGVDQLFAGVGALKREPRDFLSQIYAVLLKTFRNETVSANVSPKLASLLTTIPGNIYFGSQAGIAALEWFNIVDIGVRFFENARRDEFKSSSAEKLRQGLTLLRLFLFALKAGTDALTLWKSSKTNPAGQNVYARLSGGVFGLMSFFTFANLNK